MMVRGCLFTLSLLLHNGCGGPCPVIECDDLINVVFTAEKSPDYRVNFDGTQLECVDGQPQQHALAACGSSGFLLRSSALVIELSVVGEDWGGTLSGSLERLRPENIEHPGCEIPCTRAETEIHLTRR
jgi:hypothetical protein